MCVYCSNMPGVKSLIIEKNKILFILLMTKVNPMLMKT